MNEGQVCRAQESGYLIAPLKERSVFYLKKMESLFSSTFCHQGHGQGAEAVLPFMAEGLPGPSSLPLGHDVSVKRGPGPHPP